MMHLLRVMRRMAIRKLKSSKKFPQGPVRTCVICRTKAFKKELVRFSIPVDSSGTERKGRGAYVCVEHDSKQIERYKKKLAKALRCDVEALHNLIGKIRS
jgi:predicted RNA-binding protein YlxR (DUF448 family)